MRLTSFTDYGLRVLMLLGLRNGELTTIREIAQSYHLSENHLLKIVQALARLGYVEPVRGRSGGIRLATEPREIRLSAVVRQLEPDFALVDCMDDERRETCVISSACRLQRPLARAMEAFFEVLDQYTLEDLLQRPARLKSLLGIGAAADVQPRTPLHGGS